MELVLDTPEVFVPLLEPARYKGAYGGRGSGKSHCMAENLIDDSLNIKGLTSVCIREVQKTLKQSAKKLIENKINEHRLQHSGFKVFNDAIQTPGDGVIIFQGMQDHNAESIKSLEGFQRAWVEEAQTLSEGSLRMLRPTIRSPGSELWFSWNPRRKIDPVDRLLRGEVLPKSSIVIKANWNDNPWFPQELEDERLFDLENNPDSYDHVWEGGYIKSVDGAYYAKALARARSENRIGHVPRDPLMHCYAFFDIGGTGAKADACAIWIFQFVGKEVRAIDYRETVGQELSEHVGWLVKNNFMPHNTNIYLPHDGVKHDAVFRVSYESELVKAGYKVEVLPNAGSGAASQRIEATRRVFPRVWIDETKCEGGLEALGWYHEKKDEGRNIGLGPEHDWSSHGADSFGEMAVNIEKVTRTRKGTKKPRRAQATSGGWMRG